MTQVLDFLWGSIQYKDFAFLGLIQRDLWGPLRPGKISGHGLSQYSFQGTIYAKSAMMQVLVILGGFSENRFFGTYQIIWMSDLGGLTLVPYGLLGPNGDTKLLIWPIPLIKVKTAMTQVLDFVWDQIVHSPVDFSYKWRRFHRTPYGLAEPGDSGLW